MTVTRDVNGWTVVTPSGDSRIIYVDASQADDSGDGLSEGAAKKTLAAGYALIRDAFPDHMLLKRGEVWYDAFPRWDKAGRSQQEPQYLSAYGTGVRPEVRNKGLDKTRGGGYFIMQSLSFYAEDRDPAVTPVPVINGATGIALYAKESTQYLADVVIEDCSFKLFASAANVQGREGRITNLEIRRCQGLDSYHQSAHSQGFYVEGVVGLIIEENVLDHCGWYGDRDTGGSVGANATIFNHNMYLQYTFGSSNTIVRNNISMRASSHGVQQRVGGEISGNLFVRNPLHILIAANEGGGQNKVTNNVLMEANDISSGAARQQNMECTPNQSVLSMVTDNLIAHSVIEGGVNERGIRLDRKSSEGAPYGEIDNFIVSRNTFYKSFNKNYGFSNTPTNTQVEDNLYWTDATSGTNKNIQTEGIDLADPTRMVASYDAANGGAGTFDSFVANVRGNTKDNWDVKWTAAVINQWLKEGYVAGNIGPKSPTNLIVTVV